MLDAIRRLVYRMGRRPKPNTILYSPSLGLMYAYLDHVLPLFENNEYWTQARLREKD